MGEGQQNELTPNPVQQVYEEPDRVPGAAGGEPSKSGSFRSVNWQTLVRSPRGDPGPDFGMRDQEDTGRMNNLPIRRFKSVQVRSTRLCRHRFSATFPITPSTSTTSTHPAQDAHRSEPNRRCGAKSVCRFTRTVRKDGILARSSTDQRSRAAVSAHAPTAHTKGAQLTNRAETGIRNGDGLEFTPAKRVISAHTPAQPPTRFRAITTPSSITSACPAPRTSPAWLP